MKKNIVHLRDVIYSYEENEAPAVNGVSLDVAEGEFLAVLGRNGSGKSTLARILNALNVPQSGEVVIGGVDAMKADPFEVREICGMVFQNPDNQIVASVVEEDCAFGLENRGVEPGEIRRRVDEALEEVGMSDRALSSPNMLSGGQKQRVAIAGVLAMRPKIIVFDESTAMLDPIGRKDIFSIARRINREEGITVIWITHFMEEAALANRVCVMDDGRIMLEGAPREVFTNVEQILKLGLDVPEMMKLSAQLRKAGLDIRNDLLTVDEMAVELCRLK